jgi:Rrf2 family iron-sulfur cluster assembly transcriptional regulator
VLGRHADAISIGEVMAAADEPVRMTRCLGEGDGCVASRRCNTHFLWDALGAHIEQFLATATLADVLRGRYSMPAARFSLSELAAAAKVGS